MQPRQQARGFMQAAGLAVAILLVFTGTAIAETVEERLQAVLQRIEALVTKLALDDSLDAEETDALRSDLASVYRELTALQSEYARPAEPAEVPQPPGQTEAAPPAPAAPESPAADSSGEEVKPSPGDLSQAETSATPVHWQTYPKAKAMITPPEACFTGWGETADIDFRWGGYGQVIIEVANGDYQAQWTIDDAYHGSVNVSTQSQPEGGILIHVDDDQGQHQFLLQNGGLGPLLHQVTQVTQQPAAVAVAAALDATAVPAPAALPAPAAVWYQAYREQVASGSLAGSEALEWFISQCETGEYADSMLAQLGGYLGTLGGEARPSLGRLHYSVDGQPRSVEIPDPRVNPVSFVQIINRIFGFKASEEEYSLELAAPQV